MATKAKVSRSRQAMILDAAKQLFYERSFAAVGVDEIGERAGVTGPAIYRHFQGKDEILSILFNDAIDRLVEATSFRSEDPWEELETLVRGHADFVMDERELAGVKIREERSLAQPFRRSLHRRERNYMERWLAVMERCYPGHDAQELATAVEVALGALNSIPTWSRDALTGERTTEIITQVVLRGLYAFQEVGVQRSAA